MNQKEKSASAKGERPCCRLTQAAIVIPVSLAIRRLISPQALAGINSQSVITPLRGPVNRSIIWVSTHGEKGSGDGVVDGRRPIQGWQD